jgi:hypothetical protein
MKKNWCVYLLVLFLFTGMPISAFSQQVDYWSAKKFEFSTAVSYEFSLMKTSYFHQFSPPFLSGPYESNAEQTIYLNGEHSWGLSAAISYFPMRKLGLQFQLEYGKPRIGGTNTVYDVHLNYAIGDFAGGPPYPYIFEKTYDWPNTEGYLTQICLSLNAVVRFPLSKRVALYISGGPTYFRTSAEGVGLTYSKFWIENSYFVGETYQMKFKLGPINKLGLNIGAELNWVLFSNVCLAIDMRYYGASKESPSLEIQPNEILSEPPFDEVRKTMNLGKIEVNPSFYRVHVGLKYLF